MVRGLISGTFFGGVLSAVVLGTTSLVSPPPPGNRPPLAPDVAAPGLPDGAGALTTDGGDVIPDGSRDMGGAPQPSETPEVSSPGDSPATISALPDADTAPPAVPQTGEVDRAIAEPAAPRTAPTLATGQDGPVTLAPVADGPAAPAPEAAPAAATESGTPLAAPGAVVVAAPDLASPGATPGAEDGASVAVADADAAPGTGPAPAAPAAPAASPTDNAVSRDAATSEPAAQTGLAGDPTAPAASDAPALPDAGAGPDVTTETPDIAAPAIDDLPPATPQPLERILVEVPDDPAEPGTVTADAAESAGPADDAAPPDVDDAALPAPVASDAPVDEAELPRVAAPESSEAPEVATDVQEVIVETSPRIALRGDAATLPGGDDAVRVLRPGGETDGTENAEENPDAPDAPADPDAPAIIAHAADWAPEDPGKPVMSVVLIDDGRLGAVGPAAISELPVPVSIAVDATAEGAGDRVAAYRAAGFEVMAVARLPDGATPQDAEVILGAAFDLVPQTIGLLDPGDGGLQADREVTEIAMARLAADGRGFVTASQGLNMALRTAEAAGVPAGVLYRDLDAEGQSAQVIRRFLDQAAFRARQQSGVILVARLRPDTISALTLWSTANRAGQVELAPVSAVLRALMPQ